MKRTMLVAVAAVTIVIAMVGGVFAAGSTPITVNATATIVTKCVVGGLPTIDFGSLDPSVTGPYLGTVTNPTLWCSSGDSVSVADNGGQNGVAGVSWKLKSGANLIPYTLTYSTPIIGAGKTVDIGGQGAGKLGITASIPAGNIDTVPAGTYTDAVILTFTY